MSWRDAILLILVLGAVAFLVFKRGGNIGVEEAKRLVGEGAELVDVRTVEEYAQGHIDGAINIPLHELGQRLGELEKDKPIVLYCRSGNRSGSAMKQLQAAGFEEVHNLGAMSRW